MKVSVIIAYVNAIDDLRATVESHAEALKDFDYEIIICDNGSDDPDLRELSDFLATRSDTKLVFEYIKGTVAPFQKAAKAAVGEYLCISDQHIQVAPDYYKKQLAILDANPDIGTLYARCYFDFTKSDPVYDYNWGYNGNWRGSFNNHPRDTKPYPVLVSQMGAALVRRKLFEDFGGFSASCFNKWGGYSAEEIILGLKTWMWGQRVVMNPDTWYIHAGVVATDARGVIRNQPEAMATAAYLLGGDKYLENLVDAWIDRLTAEDAPYKTRQEAIDDIKQYTAEDRQWLLKNQKVSFDKIIAKFEKETLWT